MLNTPSNILYSYFCLVGCPKCKIVIIVVIQTQI